MIIWLRQHIEVSIEETEPLATQNVVVLVEKASLPRSFNVEVGAYLNAIRSGPDILATALAERYSVCDPKHAYFPIAESAASFVAGNYKGRKFVYGLPASERSIIEALKPYKGGNEMLCTLHHLDIMRKHRRLIGVMSFRLV
jgi:hypothetical protein